MKIKCILFFWELFDKKIWMREIIAAQDTVSMMILYWSVARRTSFA
jgi:hypothetical protein